eukprot:GHVU01136741.1.p1 GENE.GHVU01136741.1~~GHVU01136741.1.p1  ORF type:complete len:168 (+),score=0.50 GHVU01136741.1:64-504(+)
MYSEEAILDGRTSIIGAAMDMNERSYSSLTCLSRVEVRKPRKLSRTHRIDLIDLRIGYTRTTPGNSSFRILSALVPFSQLLQSSMCLFSFSCNRRSIMSSSPKSLSTTTTSVTVAREQSCDRTFLPSFISMREETVTTAYSFLVPV